MKRNMSIRSLLSFSFLISLFSFVYGQTTSGSPAYEATTIDGGPFWVIQIPSTLGPWEYVEVGLRKWNTEVGNFTYHVPPTIVFNGTAQNATQYEVSSDDDLYVISSLYAEGVDLYFYVGGDEDVVGTEFSVELGLAVVYNDTDVAHFYQNTTYKLDTSSSSSSSSSSSTSSTLSSSSTSTSSTATYTGTPLYEGEILDGGPTWGIAIPSTLGPWKEAGLFATKFDTELGDYVFYNAVVSYNDSTYFSPNFYEISADEVSVYVDYYVPEADWLYFGVGGYENVTGTEFNINVEVLIIYEDDSRYTYFFNDTVYLESSSSSSSSATISTTTTSTTATVPSTTATPLISGEIVNGGPFWAISIPSELGPWYEAGLYAEKVETDLGNYDFFTAEITYNGTTQVSDHVQQFNDDYFSVYTDKYIPGEWLVFDIGGYENVTGSEFNIEVAVLIYYNDGSNYTYALSDTQYLFSSSSSLSLSSSSDVTSSSTSSSSAESVSSSAASSAIPASSSETPASESSPISSSAASSAIPASSSETSASESSPISSSAASSATPASESSTLSSTSAHETTSALSSTEATTTLSGPTTESSTASSGLTESSEPPASTVSSSTSSPSSTNTLGLTGELVNGEPEWTLSLPGTYGPWSDVILNVSKVDSAEGDFDYNSLSVEVNGVVTKAYTNTVSDSAVYVSFDFTVDSTDLVSILFGGSIVSGNKFTSSAVLTISTPGSRLRLSKRAETTYTFESTITLDASSSEASSVSTSSGAEISGVSSVSSVSSFGYYNTTTSTAPSGTTLTSTPTQSDTVVSTSTSETGGDLVTSTVQTTYAPTTIVTVTSCSAFHCSLSAVTTGVTVVTETLSGVVTSFTTYCPLTATSGVSPTTTSVSSTSAVVPTAFSRKTGGSETTTSAVPRLIPSFITGYTEITAVTTAAPETTVVAVSSGTFIPMSSRTKVASGSTVELFETTTIALQSGTTPASVPANTAAISTYEGSGSRLRVSGTLVGLLSFLLL